MCNETDYDVRERLITIGRLDPITLPRFLSRLSQYIGGTNYCLGSECSPWPLKCIR